MYNYTFSLLLLFFNIKILSSAVEIENLERQGMNRFLKKDVI